VIFYIKLQISRPLITPIITIVVIVVVILTAPWKGHLAFRGRGLVLPGRWTAWRKAGISREIWDGWQP